MNTPVEQAVIAANRGFYDAFCRRDTAAMARLWARSHPVACVHPGWEAIHGREAVLASFRAILGSTEAPEIHSSADVAIVLGEAAFVTCVEHLRGAELVATNVFVFEEGAWRLVHHHASPMGRTRSSAPGSSSSLN